MLKTYEKFRLVDENKNNEFYAEVNWNEKDKESNECKLIKFTFPDGQTSVIKKEHLLSFLFALGNEEEQRKMVPQTISRIRWYETVLSIKAKKDIRKGEDIVVPVKLSLPPIEQEVISEIGAHIKRRAN